MHGSRNGHGNILISIPGEMFHHFITLLGLECIMLLLLLIKGETAACVVLLSIDWFLWWTANNIKKIDTVLKILYYTILFYLTSTEWNLYSIKWYFYSVKSDFLIALLRFGGLRWFRFRLRNLLPSRFRRNLFESWYFLSLSLSLSFSFIGHHNTFYRLHDFILHFWILFYIRIPLTCRLMTMETKFEEILQGNEWKIVQKVPFVSVERMIDDDSHRLYFRY